MKKCLALLLLLCLLAPACALADITIINKNGDMPPSAADSVDLIQDFSPYTISGTSDKPVKLQINGDVTVILNGVSITSSGPDTPALHAVKAQDASSASLELVIARGTKNTLVSSASGLRAQDMDLTISGDPSGTGSAGTLEITSENDSIYAGDDLTIADGAVVTANSHNYAGIYSTGDLIIEDGAQVSASSNGDGYFTLMAENNIVMTTGAQVTAEALGMYSYALHAWNNIECNLGVRLYARVFNGGTSIQASNEIRIGADAVVEAIADGNGCCAISAFNRLTIMDDAVVTAHAAGQNSFAVRTGPNGTLMLRGMPQLEAVGGEAALKDYSPYPGEPALTKLDVENGIPLLGRNSVKESWRTYVSGMRALKTAYPSGSMPQTGDSSMMAAWACLMLAALSALAVMRLRRARG